MLTPAPRAYGVADPAEVRQLSGREFLQAMMDGRLPTPPIMKTLSFSLTEIGDGLAVFEGDAGPHLLNPLGIVHGGWAMTLIDSAAGCAAHTLLPAGASYATIETKANFSRPIAEDSGRVRAEGRAVGRGRRIISCEARVVDAKGRLLAHGTSTLMVLDVRRACETCAEASLAGALGAHSGPIGVVPSKRHGLVALYCHMWAPC